MCHSAVFFFYTKTGLASQSGWRISLMNPTAISFVISFLIDAFLSSENVVVVASRAWSLH
jgi:hypothetical protein